MKHMTPRNHIQNIERVPSYLVRIAPQPNRELPAGIKRSGTPNDGKGIIKKKKKGPPSLGIREILIKSPRIISNTSDFSES